MPTTKKGLGRGLSALIPDADMEFLSRVARGETVLPAVPLSEDAFAADRMRPSTVAVSTMSSPVATVAPETGTASPAAPSASPMAATPTHSPAEIATGNAPIWIDVHQIAPNPYQPRRIFDDEEMRDLVASVREHGIIQAVLVRPKTDAGGGQGEPGYQLIAGERRWRAAQTAGLAKVPAVVRAVSDQQALELALIENVQRHDISAVDAARAYRRLADEFGLAQEDIARRVGKSRSAIANTIRLLDLPQEAQNAIEDGTISEGHGRAILSAPGDGARRAVFRRILRDKVTVREAEEMARKAVAVGDAVGDAGGDAAGDAGGDAGGIESESRSVARSPRRGRLNTAEVRALRVTEEQLSGSLGTRVRIRPRAKGGQICIEYFSADDLDHLLARLRAAGK